MKNATWLSVLEIPSPLPKRSQHRRWQCGEEGVDLLKQRSSFSARGNLYVSSRLPSMQIHYSRLPCGIPMLRSNSRDERTASAMSASSEGADFFCLLVVGQLNFANWQLKVVMHSCSDVEYFKFNHHYLPARKTTFDMKKLMLRIRFSHSRRASGSRGRWRRRRRRGRTPTKHASGY